MFIPKKEPCSYISFNALSKYASGLTVCPLTKKVLLVHHKKFNKWNQPGGHIEDNETK